MRKIFSLLCLSFLVCSCFGETETINCPETLLKDFSTKIKSQADAEKIFREYFSTAKGFPAFDKTMIKTDDSPSCSGSLGRKSVCYFYFDFYGMGPSGVGGYLYPDGRLVKRGYCK